MVTERKRIHSEFKMLDKFMQRHPVANVRMKRCQPSAVKHNNLLLLPSKIYV